MPGYESERRQRSTLRSQSLLQRLRADDQRISNKPGNPVEERIRTIKANLHRLLNTRKGASFSDPKYGLADFNDASVGSSDMLQSISRDIHDIIMKYEPRVENVQVMYAKNNNAGLELYFKISASTRIHHRSEEVTIDLVLRDGRRFMIE